MFKEAFESLSSSLSERLVNPFTGSFLMSWPIWNYKLILIVFSDSKVQVKISLISNLAYPSWQVALFLGVVAPTFTALGYIYLYPFPTKWFIEYSLKKKRELKSIRQKVDDETLLTKEESDKLKRKYNLGAKILEDELEEKTNLIRDLRDQAAKNSEGAAEIQREQRELKSDLEVVKASHADLASELRSAQKERDRMLQLNQNLKIELSSSEGKIVAMTDEIASLRSSLAESQTRLNSIYSEFSALKHQSIVSDTEKAEALSKLQGTSEYNSELEIRMLEALEFISAVRSRSEVPEGLRMRAESVASNIDFAMRKSRG